MKKPRVEDFDPKHKEKQIKPEAVDFSGAPEIKRYPGDSESPPKKPGATKQPSNHDTVIPRYHDTTSSNPVEVVRKAVKQIGKEAATHRFTQEEKQQLADIIYTYARHGCKTSENEVARIAINWLILDYHERGQDSMLDKVLKALNE